MPGGHAQLDPCGRVLDDLSEGRRNEAGDHQSDPLLDPDADEEHGAGGHQPARVAPQRVDHEGDGRPDIEHDSRPDPRHQCVVLAEPEEEIARADAVVGGE